MTPTIWAAVGAVGAALAAALIARSVKISEFRQAWINELRADISEFISKSHEWIDLYLNFNAENNNEKKAALAPALDRIKYDALHVLRRIELRFKPDDLEGNVLLLTLRDLLNPAKLTPDSQYPSWRRLADDTTVKARHLLKEEWEVTKNPFRSARKFGFRG
ncbi:hypothetical protein CS053_00255 [Rhodanobacter glycinis]|uniref:DUF4760 domain-containing protein n=1 Tax=Rhodanobacter glycinis TaxID=582702 RepID=A0A5B9E7M8_9GAMM|nr:hypothetical protein [Rhodanobacter glycinis]QEE26247.1 hypothetical protein CS053_00255 [Rhodanobacter glycinis]